MLKEIKKGGNPPIPKDTEVINFIADKILKDEIKGNLSKAPVTRERILKFLQFRKKR